MIFTYPERVSHHEPLDQDTLKLAQRREHEWTLRYSGCRYQGCNVCHNVTPRRVENQAIDCLPVDGKAYEGADDIARP